MTIYEYNHYINIATSILQLGTRYAQLIYCGTYLIFVIGEFGSTNDVEKSEIRNPQNKENIKKSYIFKEILIAAVDSAMTQSKK